MYALACLDPELVEGQFKLNNDPISRMTRERVFPFGQETLIVRARRAFVKVLWPPGKSRTPRKRPPPPALPPILGEGSKERAEVTPLPYCWRKGWGWGQAAVCDLFRLAFYDYDRYHLDRFRAR